MRPSPVTRHSSLVGALALVLLCATAAAQMTNDPTRPPAGIESGAAGLEADAGGGPMLQSVLISPTQKAAIIGGVMVKLGEKYGDAVLVKVAENEVVLKSGATLQVLKLYPGVEKREIAPAADKSAQRRAKAVPSTAPAR
jgi:MSHA biogenesis protein MshK